MLHVQGNSNHLLTKENRPKLYHKYIAQSILRAFECKELGLDISYIGDGRSIFVYRTEKVS